jgi:hypothetical protein
MTNAAKNNAVGAFAHELLHAGVQYVFYGRLQYYAKA